jgi:UDP-N-acetylmuramoylalanine--D-glutamate ligase
VVKSNNVATVLLNRADIQLKGEHNLVNLLTVLAICQALNINLAKVANALSDYRGLAHRFEVVNTDTNAQWINDSKATNVGACLAALDCFEAHDYLVLIAGGDAKGANLQQLESALREKVNDLIVFGKDASSFASLHANVYPVDSLAEAVAKASKCIHQKSDATVLLSPACASIDMFANYQARGDQFKALVTQLTTNGEAKAQAVNHG